MKVDASLRDDGMEYIHAREPCVVLICAHIMMQISLITIYVNGYFTNNSQTWRKFGVSLICTFLLSKYHQTFIAYIDIGYKRKSRTQLLCVMGENGEIQYWGVRKWRIISLCEKKYSQSRPITAMYVIIPTPHANLVHPSFAHFVLSKWHQTFLLYIYCTQSMKLPLFSSQHDHAHLLKSIRWLICAAWGVSLWIAEWTRYKVGMFGVILTVQNAQMRDAPNLREVWELLHTWQWLVIFPQW